MLAAIRTTWSLLVGITFLMLGIGLQGTLLGVRAAIEGFSTTITGVVMSAYFVGFLLGSVLTPKLVERVGHIRVFAALASLASIAVLAHILIIEPITWAAIRLITGICAAGLAVVAESWLNARADNETRGQLLSVYMIVTLAGIALGQFLLNLADPAGFELFVIVSILVSLALIPMLLSVTPAPRVSTPARVGLKQLYAISPLGAIGCLGTGMADGAFFGMGAVYAESIGLSVAEISSFMGIAVIGGMLLQWPIGSLSDRYDRRTVLTFVVFLTALIALIAGLTASLSKIGLLISIALFGGLYLPTYSLCVAHTNDYLDSQQMVAASGSLVLVFGIGASIGPLITALAMSWFGDGGFFWFLTLIHLALGAFALYRIKIHVATPMEAQGPTIPYSRTATPYTTRLTVDEPEKEKGAKHEDEL